MMKKVLVYTLKVERRRQSIVLFDFTDNMHIGGLKFQTYLCLSANDFQSPQVLILGL